MAAFYVKLVAGAEQVEGGPNVELTAVCDRYAQLNVVLNQRTRLQKGELLLMIRWTHAVAQVPCSSSWLAPTLHAKMQCVSLHLLFAVLQNMEPQSASASRHPLHQLLGGQPG
jgi:hypothetical protein